jgi:uncharacterized protein (TIGR02231 family)
MSIHLVVLLSLGAAGELDSRISAVTVFADRAQVTRTASVELGSGPQRFAVTKLPGWIDPESVRVSVEPPSAGQLLDVVVETTHLAESSAEAVRKSELAQADAADALSAVADEEKTLNEEIARLEALRGMSLDKVPRELAAGDVKVKLLGDTMAYVTDTVRSDRMKLRALAKKRRDLEPVLEQRQRELADVQAGSQLQQSTVQLELKGSGHAAVHITYLTPGATWEPLAEVRASRGGTAISLAQLALVSQTTGEDWTGAKLSFSTQDPTATLDVPKLQQLMLDNGGARLSDVVYGDGVSGGSFSRAQSAYALGNEVAARNSVALRESLQRQQETQSRVAARFSKLGRRGTTTHFAALEGTRTVRADGKVVRVPLSQVDLTATQHIVAAPEVSLNAVRVAELSNGGSTPILPGRAMLFEDGAFVGRAELPFAAPGERFSVFLGVDDRIKLERLLDKKTSSLHRRGSRTELDLSFAVAAENLGGAPVVLEISERIPVAQTEEIEVNDVELPDRSKPDAQGLVKFSRVLAPRTKSNWRVAYNLYYPTDYVARMRAASTPETRSVAPRPAAAAEPMHERINMLEDALR